MGSNASHPTYLLRLWFALPMVISIHGQAFFFSLSCRVHGESLLPHAEVNNVCEFLPLFPHTISLPGA
jgi:hypothetical protein